MNLICSTCNHEGPMESIACGHWSHCANFAKARAAISEHCEPSRRVDKKHSWVFDGDDPYIVCAYCDEMRDALTGRVVRPAANPAS